MNTPLHRLQDQGIAALRQGDALSARAAFERLEAAGLGTPQLRLLIAQACAMLGDGPGSHRALDRVLAVEPTNLYALIMRGDLLARHDDRAAVTWYRAALTHAAQAGNLPADLIQRLRHAERAVADAGTAFRVHLADSLAANGISIATAGPRFAESLDLLAGRAEVQLQQPTSFYYPQLAPRPFFEREDFPWVAALEGAAAAMRTELAAVLGDVSALSPYVAAQPNRPAKHHPLLADPRWSAFHLFYDGAPVPANAARCPATMAALARVPIPAIAGRSPIAMFSVLQAGTHIPPHHGMINTRLICHLPLIVPTGCRLRVGNETRMVEVDRVMIFDDSMEHEAWNDGDSTRAVLLFEIWRPELDETERTALTTLFEAITLYAPTASDQAGA